MIQVIEEALDKAYKDYIFIGREKLYNDDGTEKEEPNPVVDLGVSRNEDALRQLFFDFEAADKNFKYRLLDYVLAVFEKSNEDDYVALRKKIKRVKLQRYKNKVTGKLLA